MNITRNLVTAALAALISLTFIGSSEAQNINVGYGWGGPGGGPGWNRHNTWKEPVNDGAPGPSAGSTINQRHILTLDKSGLTPYTDGNGKNWYGLFIQKVTTTAYGKDCDGNDVFSGSNSYFEWSWITDEVFIDTFGSGTIPCGGGDSRQGEWKKEGESQIIPITPEEVEIWINEGIKPKALQVADELQDDANDDWNTETNDEGNTPVTDSAGDDVELPPGVPMHSGGWPNTTSTPSGWDDGFGGTSSTLYRVFSFEWDYCGQEVGN